MRQGPGGRDGVDNFNVAVGVLAAEADGVDGNALAADGVDGVEIDAAGIVGAVAEEDHRAQREGGRFGEDALEGVADAGGGGSSVQLRGVGNAFDVFAKFVDTDLEALAEFLE